MQNKRIVLVGGIFLALSLGGKAWAQGEFEYSFTAAPQLAAPDLGPTQSTLDPLAYDCIENDGPDWPAGSDVLAGPPSTVVQGSYYCTLEQLDPGTTPGAQGWQLSMTADNGSIDAITVTQTNISPGDIASCDLGPGATSGFDNTELTLAENNGGVAGAVSVVVLHLKKLTTLDPTGLDTHPATGPQQNPATVARILVSSTLPDENAAPGEGDVLTLRYLDGLKGAGKEVDNKVTQDRQSVLPSKATKEITLHKSEFALGWRNAPQLPAPDLGPTQNIGDPLASDCTENDGPDWPAGSDTLSGPPGSAVQGSYYCTLEQLDPGITLGAQGWQLSMTVDNGSIDAITVTQTDISPGDIASCDGGPGTTGGFDNTELTLAENNGGVAGAVSVVVLHLKKLTTLDPTGLDTHPATGPQENPATVARVLVSSVLSAVPGESNVMTLRYVDGFKGSGNEVDNKVTQDTYSVLPSKATKEIALEATSSFTLGWRDAPQLPAPDLGPTQSILDPLASDCIENDGPDWPAGSDTLEGPPNSAVRGSYYCTLEQLDPGITSGAQGWQLGFTATGCDAVVLAITTTQTDISPGDIASCETGPGTTGGFDNSELALAENNGGLTGATSAVVLHLKKVTTLDPTGSNTPPATGPEENPLTVCRLLVEYTAPETLDDSCDTILTYVDGLKGRGKAIDNKITQDARSVIPQKLEKTVTVTANASSRQLAGDCNQDGSLDISDTICLLGYLFQASPPTLPCGPLATSPGNIAVFDGNGDSNVDLSDAIYKLSFLFSGGPPPVQGTDCFSAPDCPHNSNACP